MNASSLGWHVSKWKFLLIPNPMCKALSTMATQQAQARLMGAKVCVFYGTAECGRDTELAALAEPQNFERLR